MRDRPEEEGERNKEGESQREREREKKGAWSRTVHKVKKGANQSFQGRKTVKRGENHETSRE